MKTRTKRLLIIPLVAFVLGAAWLFPPPPHQLLAKSVRVPGIHPGYQKDDYYWLSDHEMLLFHPSPAPHWRVARRDLRAPSETPLPALERLFQQTGGDPWSVKVSPDHTRLIWAGLGKVIYGATLDGQQFQRWPYGKDEYGISYWLSDNAHFLRYREATSSRLPIVIRSVADPHHVKHLLWSGQNVPPGWTLPRPFPANERVYVESAGDSFLISRFTPDKVERIVKNRTLPPTDDNEYLSDERFLSDGDALLWTTSRQPPPKTPAFFWDFLGRLGWRPKPYKTMRVSVSRADGTQPRFTGDWEQPQVGFPNTGQYPHNFRLLPGGKGFSFEQQGKLYTAPAE